MAEAPKNLSEKEKQYYIGRLKDRKKSVGNFSDSTKRSDDLPLNDEDADEEESQPQISPEDAKQISSDEPTTPGQGEDEEEGENLGDSGGQSVPSQNQPTEEKKPAKNKLTQLEGESPEDFQQRQMNAGKIPSSDYQARQQEQQSAIPGGKSDMSDKAIRDRELKRLQETTTNLDTGKTKRNGSSLKIGATALNNRYQDIKEKFSPEALKERLKNQLKKLAFDAIKKVAAEAATAAGGWIVANIVPILLVIAGIVLAIILIVVIVRSRQAPNAEGSSPVIAVDVVTDHPLLKSILALSSPADFQKMLNDNKQSLIIDFASFEAQLQNLHAGDPAKIADTKAKLDQATVLINAYTTPDATKAAAIMKLIVDAVKPWAIELRPGALIFPAGKSYSARNVSGGGHYDLTGSINPSGRIHGGIDVMMHIDTPLFAATDGKVVYIHDNEKNEEGNHMRDNSQNHGFGNLIIVQMDTPIGDAQFWECHHISPGTAINPTTHTLYKVGDHMKQGDPLALSGHNGASSGAHLHFEVDSRFCSGTDFGSCNTSGSLQYTINPLSLLGWK